MQIIKTFKGLKIYSPAKINLFLEVIGKRKDGYHEIESIMQTINLFDTLYLQQSRRSISIVTNCSELPSDDNNLAYRAAILMQKEYHVKRGVKINLHKRIPIGGGLGGGSSNAAATLIGLNKLWELGLSKCELVSLALRLGSDVPFFIYGGTALVKGRGEIVFPLLINRSFYYFLVAPTLIVPTKNIYNNLEIYLTKPIFNINIIVGKLLTQKVKYEEVKGLLYNRLESVALNLYPVLRSTYYALQKITVDGILLSGSGSTIFKLCSCKKEANYLLNLLSRKYLGNIFITKSLN
ncbi:MAG: 4-(cytidine 5'-diphospho)-2-C-methyl-D-erythritol kinase [Planctomycetota bacterium]